MWRTFFRRNLLPEILTMLFFVISTPEGFAQFNLVPNPSFEQHDSCTRLTSNIQHAIPWIEINVSPDYFNRCSNNSSVGVPSNFAGFQFPKDSSDNGYAGIITIPTSDSVHEILGVKLINQLIVGTKYYCKLYYNSANHWDCYCNRLGMKFVNSIDTSDFMSNKLINNSAHVFTDSILSDTLNWQPLNGSFIADSAYKYVLIGNFFKPAQLNCNCSGGWAYTYIDQVCVSDDSTKCLPINIIQNPESKSDLFAYINYGSNELIIVNRKNNSTDVNINIYDTCGRQVAKLSSNETSITLNISNWAQGLYLIQIENMTFKIIF